MKELYISKTTLTNNEIRSISNVTLKIIILELHCSYNFTTKNISNFTLPRDSSSYYISYIRIYWTIFEINVVVQLFFLNVITIDIKMLNYFMKILNSSQATTLPRSCNIEYVHLFFESFYVS